MEILSASAQENLLVHNVIIQLERKYTVGEKGLLGIVKGLKAFVGVI